MSALNWYVAGVAIVILLGAVLTFSSARALPLGPTRTRVEVLSLLAVAAALAAVALLRGLS